MKSTTDNNGAFDPNNPVAVFRSSTKADAYVVLTELMEVDARSVYGPGDNQLSKAFRDDLLYMSEE
ncbi:hypothetical protein HT665_01430 [Ursidibacter maritimus]|uniref:Uncharacterized protein n=1 Tax=Ursidibacter maritimus TaxID=1331689 RepID=A0A949SYW8_9PAST|nr:hypothetical protein [Ursidibacter maritimus]KAE9539232.1 hypothetical protein A1D26_04200 [Ursidibacter maritimus]MBV6524590.1 hypothetical protein [Ursidibacter maritimus]MBV6525435.1 hypothetical protein [Ursidibacter maritimus]MBV6526905.1 hypothetical protein [Ursidibacter maritimus]MBV6530378.1 hypothetical protein [Ursidibacter maritimus]